MTASNWITFSHGTPPLIADSFSRQNRSRCSSRQSRQPSQQSPKSARPLQLHPRQPDADGIQRVGGHGPVIGKEAQFPPLALVFIEHLQRLAPCGLLAVVDLAEIEHLALRGRPVA